MGRTVALEFEVTEADTAIALLSGDLPVLATPRLVAWLEAATCAAVADVLDDGRTTVGTSVSVEHRAASAVGEAVLASATLSDVEGKVLTFDVSASDRATGRVLGGGTIVRALVNRETFLARLSGQPTSG